MTDHLNDDQIDLLLDADSSRDHESATDSIVDQDLNVHLENCELCQKTVRERKNLMVNLDRTRIHDPSPAGEGCPADEVWYFIAAGIPGAENEAHLRHVLNCEHCGFLLQQIAQELADVETLQETARIDEMASATAKWQESTALMLSKAAHPSPILQIGESARPRGRNLFSLKRLVFASLAVSVASAVLLLFWLQRLREPSILIERAYTEQRTIELRMDRVPYVPLRQQRGTDGTFERMGRPALLAAEAEAARELKLHPDDVHWLQASGRANLLEDNLSSVQAAVTFLEKAHRLAPDDTSISVDLASAYILRGDLAPVDPKPGEAIEILRPLAESSQGGETAQWNYAIAQERAGFWSNAVTEWQNFLDRYPRSAWAGEAQRKLKADQARVEDQHHRSSIPLQTLEKVAAAYQSRNQSALAEIDSRIEEYQDVAVARWLPLLFSKARGADFQAANAALTGLAETLRKNHGDPWLGDFLGAGRRVPARQYAIRLLSHSASLLETSDAPTAEREAIIAASLFRKTHEPAGEFRSRLIVVFAAQYEHRDGPCEHMARTLAASPKLGRYPWIVIQANLETSLCSLVHDSQSVHAADNACDLAVAHRFPVLRARCTDIESTVYGLLGERDLAWVQASKALNMYWDGSLPPLRGYNALIGFEELNQPSERWNLQADILREAIPMVQNDPRTLMVAVASAHLGQALIHLGDLSGAQAAFLKSDALIRNSIHGSERDALWSEIQLGLAQIDLERNQASQCLERLQRIRQLILNMPNSPLQIEYLQTSGRAFLAMNRIEEAQQDLSAAVVIVTDNIDRVGSVEEKWKSDRRYEDLFRTIVELELRVDSKKALFAWEYYKSLAILDKVVVDPQFGDRTVSWGTLTNPVPISLGKQQLALTYVALPNGYVVWGRDSQGIREQWVKLDMETLSSVTSRFLMECSDPSSSLISLKNDGAKIYSDLIRPIEPWLIGHTQIEVEPDGALAHVPFALLVDSKGSYFGDRFDIAFSPGLAYLTAGRKWMSLSSNSAAYIVASPSPSGWTPLPAAEQEARAVASIFSHPGLLIGQNGIGPKNFEEISQAQVFHFAGHASTSSTIGTLLVGNPDFSSALNLSALRGGQTQLIVLSACSTFSGTDEHLDDDGNVVRSLLAAHVSTVVASRWNVDSSSTALLMKSLYSNLLAQHTTAWSLSQAMRTVRRTPGYEHPYYWGAFSVFGHS
jgi:CHAT domain-containing protein